ncbi:MAG TPA: hypothetical protein EYO33_23555 [Phycisphaerales bacterium]|nr:hypothetical protein [Phycisphaerales bacterium]
MNQDLMEMGQFQRQMRRPMVSGQTVQKHESSSEPSWWRPQELAGTISRQVVQPVLKALDLTPSDIRRDLAPFQRLVTGSGGPMDVLEAGLLFGPARVVKPVARGLQSYLPIATGIPLRTQAATSIPTSKGLGVGLTAGGVISGAGLTVGVVASGLPEMALEFGESLGRGIVREAKEVATDLYRDVTGGTMDHYGSTSRRELQGFREGELIKPFEIVHTWWANNVPFARLADGRTVVRRKNGSLKIFRTPRNLIVLSSNPRVKDLVRADRRIDSIVKVVKKRLPSAKRATRTSRRSAADDVQIIRTG